MSVFTSEFGVSKDGKVYLNYGTGSGLTQSPVWTGICTQESANFGEAIANAGDVNADGYADIIIGAPGFPMGKTMKAPYLFIMVHRMDLRKNIPGKPKASRQMLSLALQWLLPVTLIKTDMLISSLALIFMIMVRPTKEKYLFTSVLQTALQKTRYGLQKATR